MREYKIGEIFEYNGEWYQCLKGISCRECDFSTNNVSCDIPGELLCTRKGRSDETSVVFKKLEKVGEPYYSSYYKQVLQEYKYYTSPIISDTKVHIFKLGIVRIEIKQNKEDMEEYEMHDAREDIPEFDKVVDECLFGKQELKLKPFDLQKAKEGKPVCTRDGRKARIICFDANGEYPLIALITLDNDAEDIKRYTVGGRYYGSSESNSDLMMLPEKKEGWVNVYKKSIYKTKEDAFNRRDKENYLMTIKIEWEE